MILVQIMIVLWVLHARRVSFSCTATLTVQSHKIRPRRVAISVGLLIFLTMCPGCSCQKSEPFRVPFSSNKNAFYM